MLGLALAAIACNPEPRGRCDSNAQCTVAGSYCNQQDHLCEAQVTQCAPACAAGYQCSTGSCVPSDTPALTFQLPPLLSPSRDQVPVVIGTNPTVQLGALTVQALAADGGVLASGQVSQASPDAGITLTQFASGAQGLATLAATLTYSNSLDAGLELRVLSTTLVEVDAVAPALSVSAEAAPDQVNGWYPRAPDAGFAVDALIDDGPLGSGPDGGVLTLSSCDAGAACAVLAALDGGVDAGLGQLVFAFSRALAPAGEEGPISFAVDAQDNAGNHAGQSGSLLVDDKPPRTGSTFTILNTDAGVIGEDGQLWFGAGTGGVDVEIALEASDDGVGLDPAALLLTLDAADIDSGQSAAVTGFFPSPPDGTVHFKVPTGRASNREGALRFTISIADKLGHAAAPIAGQLMVDDAIPVVSYAAIDYSDATIVPKRSEVCAASVACGRGDASNPTRALRDDKVTIFFSAVDCGAGLDLGAVPSVDVLSGGAETDFDLESTLVDAGPGGCANGSQNLAYYFTAQIDLAAKAPVLAGDLNGRAQVQIAQVAFDPIGGEGFSPDPGDAGGIIEVSRVRWKAPLGGRAVGSPALLPAGASLGESGARTLVVPVDGAASPSKPDGLELFDGTGALTGIPLAQSGGYDLAAGDVAVAQSGALWVAGSPVSCAGLATCSRLWVVQAPGADGNLGGGGPLLAACPSETGVLGSLALRDSDGGSQEIAVAAVADAGLGLETAGAFGWSASTSSTVTTLTCARASGTTRLGFAAASGLSIAQGSLFVAGSSGFYSVLIGAGGELTGAQAAFSDSSNNALVALPAAPSVRVLAGGASPYFAALDSLSNPKKESLREAALSSGAWGPAAAPWSNVSLADAVTHTPVFDSLWVYTVDESGTLQLSALAPSNNAVTTLSSQAQAAVSTGREARDASSKQLVSPPVLLAGSSAGSSALLVQGNGLVELAQVSPSTRGSGTPTLAETAQLQVGTFQTGVHPPTPVLDSRGTGSVAYVIDGASCTTGTSCADAYVWALQFDVAPLPASSTQWVRPGRDSCNSRDADGVCP